jgi:hypothetical protein
MDIATYSFDCHEYGRQNLIVPYCLFWTLNLLIFIGIAFCKFIKFCRIDSIYFGNFVNHLNWNRIFKDLMKYLK